MMHASSVIAVSRGIVLAQDWVGLVSLAQPGQWQRPIRQGQL
jgi:hypothetical protein